jgi:Lrp/AsnC family leucine-responsive transcriptional regulator
MNYEIDKIDRRILEHLQANGRISQLELAQAVGLSPTPLGRRIKRLEDSGVIRGYKAEIDFKALGFGINVVVSVRLITRTPDASTQFLDAIRQRPEITECLLVTGDVDYLIRVRVKDIDALRHFISHELQSLPCVSQTSTMVILDSTSFDRV